MPVMKDNAANRARAKRAITSGAALYAAKAETKAHKEMEAKAKKSQKDKKK